MKRKSPFNCFDLAVAEMDAETAHMKAAIEAIPKKNPSKKQRRPAQKSAHVQRSGSQKSA